MKIPLQAAAAAITLFASQAAHAQGAVQWKVSDGGNGHWYRMLITASPTRWEQAKLLAESIGGHLATIRSSGENAVSLAVAEGGPVLPGGSVWLGGIQPTGESSDYAWVTGEPFDWTPGCGFSNTDSGCGFEDRLTLTSPWTGCPWNDVAACWFIPALLVEWSADCNNDGVVDYGQCRDGSLPDYNGNNIPDCCESGSPCLVGNYPVQWRIEDGGNGHWYDGIALGRPVFWVEARDMASAGGGHLATPTSAEEDSFLKATFLRDARLYRPDYSCCEGPYIGAYNDGSGWRWVDGSPWSYTNWHPGNPNEIPFTVVVYWSRPECEWQDQNDVDQQYKAIGYIAEWSADCNADGIVDYGQILDGTFSDSNADGVPDVCQQAPCTPSDLTANGVVDGADLGALLAFWGPVNPVFPQADIDRNGIVNGADLGALLANWGPCGAPAWASVISWMPEPSIVTDPQLRASIQATGLPWRVRDTATGIEMLLVPPGTFEMGCVVPPDSEPCQPDEFPVHAVTITGAYYLGRYEVTQAQWLATMGSNPSFFQGILDSATRPVEQVSWNAIQPFLAASSMRLPTEAEWEYACRAGTQSPLHNGSSDASTLGDIAWFNLNSGMETHPVGLKVANSFGFHDMLGNVGEWVLDHFAPYQSAPQVDPMQLTGNYVVMRGGGWGQLRVRSSHRSYDAPNLIYFGEGGFRVARNP